MPPDGDRNEMPEDAWLALRLALLPWPIEKNGRQIPADPAIVRRLDVGDGGAAIELALRRLRIAGIRPSFNGALVDPARARQWGAALAFPITRGAARRAARLIDPAFAGKE
jgi:CRISPR-associated protein Csx17